MRNVIILAALCAAMPVAAQDNPAPAEKTAPTQEQAAPVPEKQTQEQPAKPAAAPGLEKPGTAAPAKTEGAKKPVEGAHTKTVEEIIARVNNEIITRSELDKARAAAVEEANQECQGKCTPEQLRVDVEDRQKNTLRDLIDQSLLVQRGKDMGIAVEPEVIKRHDQIRLQNKPESLECCMI